MYRSQSSRVRKPNPRIYDDDYEEDQRRMRKHSRMVSQPNYIHSPINVQKTLSSPDKRVAQNLGIALRNLLKLPKAHKWVCYEWFYSTIDSVLLDGENDFGAFLRVKFAELKTRRLHRAQWCKLRRLMGKPRRCSSAFFAEERALLQKKREKVRLIQQQHKSAEIAELIRDDRDLPDEIPMPLVIGMKVTARLRRPQDGLFSGTIDAVDTANNSYRITFDRQGLGTHTVPDIEVALQSSDDVETIPLVAFQNKCRSRQQHLSMFTPQKNALISGTNSPGLLSDKDPLLGGEPLVANLLQVEGAMYGGFPVKFLALVTKLSKILAVKREHVSSLKQMNTEAEIMSSVGRPLDTHFQSRYASTVLDLEQLNRDLNEYLIGLQQFCQELAPDDDGLLYLQPSDVQQRCDQEARDLVDANCLLKTGFSRVSSNRIRELIAKLTSLLLLIKTFSERSSQSFELRSLQDCLDEIRSLIDPSNIPIFMNNVQVHVNHIYSGLNRAENLHAFLS